MVLAEWVEIPIKISLAVVVALLAGSILASVVRPPRQGNS
jgi:hypothetical protein